MSFYKLFGGISGSVDTTSAAAVSSSISGAETIERLCDRVQSASLIEDRRDALTEIKSLSKKYKLEVGTHAMPILVDVLDNFRSDSELACLALDSLYNIMTVDTEDESEQKNLPADITTQFTEILMQKSSNVHLIFDLLDEFEFKTRWTTLKLLNVIILNQTQALQDTVLEIPRGVSRLMDLLNDTREIIRNDTLLLLNNLIKKNTNIQKIIAFESGFDRIMEIIEGEGSVIDGGIIVEDCFNLLLNLLQDNSSNQNFFKEANYIKMLCKYLDLSSAVGSSKPSDGLGLSDPAQPADAALTSKSVWTAQKTKNLSLLLRLIRCLVSPSNQHSIVTDCQKAFSNFGLLHRLCALLTLPGVPSELLGEAISTVGEVIRGNTANQTLFSSVQMQTDPPRPIIVILLMSMINEKQPFHLRCSILYCFGCYLYRNEQAKANIINTLLPSDSQNQQQQQQISTGQILCTGLFSQNEIYSNWFSAVAFLHTINGSTELKEQLLRVQLAINPTPQDQEVKAISLIQQCMNILMESTSQSQSTPNKYKFQTTVSLLMLMSTWLANCPVAVNYFLSERQNVPYLISQVASTDTSEKAQITQGLAAFLLGLAILYNSDQVEDYTVDKLRDTIKKRVGGVEQLEAKLEFISQHEMYTRTLKRPTFLMRCGGRANDLLFDYEFTRLFKANETLISNVLANKNVLPLSREPTPQQRATTPLQSEQIVQQYQQLIREQDMRIQAQFEENQSLRQTCDQLQTNCKNITSQLNERSGQSEALLTEKLTLKAKVSTLEAKCNQLEGKCTEQADELTRLKRDRGAWQESSVMLKTNDPNSGSAAENMELKMTIKELNVEQENLLTLLQDMEQKLVRYKKLLRLCGQDGELSESDEDDEEDGEAGEIMGAKSNGAVFLQNAPQIHNPASKIAVSDSIKLNNDANFDNDQDDYDYSSQPNYMHQIIDQHDYSNNVSTNPTGPNSHAGDTNNNSTSHSSCASSHNGDPLARMTRNYGVPTPGEHINNNTYQLQEQQTPVNQQQTSLVDAANEAFKNIDIAGLAPTLEDIVTSDLNANPPQPMAPAAEAVNPFFMQHPFFKQQFQQSLGGINNSSNENGNFP